MRTITLTMKMKMSTITLTMVNDFGRMTATFYAWIDAPQKFWMGNIQISKNAFKWNVNVNIKLRKH